MSCSLASYCALNGAWPLLKRPWGCMRCSPANTSSLLSWLADWRGCWNEMPPLSPQNGNVVPVRWWHVLVHVLVDLTVRSWQSRFTPGCSPKTTFVFWRFQPGLPCTISSVQSLFDLVTSVYYAFSRTVILSENGVYETFKQLRYKINWRQVMILRRTN